MTEQKKTLEQSIERALRRPRGKKGENEKLEFFREELIAELRKLIPDAVRQAKGTQRKPPSPALLRMLIRACK